MKRRTFTVVTCGTLYFTAGCLSSGQEYRAYSEGPREEAPEIGLDIELDVVGGGFSDPDQPLTLEFSITNISDAELDFEESFIRRTASFEPYFFIGAVERLENVCPDCYEYRGDCWVMTEPISTLFSFTVETLEPGETVRVPSYLLVDDAYRNGLDDDVECPEEPPETIQFSFIYKTHGDDRSIEWDFTLERRSGVIH